jgi:UDP-glucose 4-epimerase
MSILVTGGAGYIGSHTVLELIEAGYNVIVYDNLSNSSKLSLERVSRLTGKKIPFIDGDIRDESKLNNLFELNMIDAVIHFAGFKSVGESVDKPLVYYNNNVFGSLQLFKVMQNFNVKKLVFSSSATVYGEPKSVPLSETLPVGKPANPYGMSKLMIENIISDLCQSDQEFSAAVLRYFNPVGAHESGLIGEDPLGTPNNLMPFITQAAIGEQKVLSVYGSDYPTFDGTGVRDYVHVVDLAKGHLAALEKCMEESKHLVVNLGTGVGYSVLELIKTFQKVNNVKIPYQMTARRAGDVASCYADVTYADTYLNWRAKRTLGDMCVDSWRWQKQNPKGYDH